MLFAEADSWQTVIGMSVFMICVAWVLVAWIKTLD